MSEFKLTVYLAGAIRDGHPEDIAWRQQAVETLSPVAIVLNPLGGKQFDEETRQWSFAGVPSTARLIVKQDFWCVDRADVVLANLTSMAEGYPSIGTITEIGRSTARGSLIYTIIDPSFTGHENSKMYGLHPFIEQVAAAHFSSVTEALTFLKRCLRSLSGADPHFDGRT